MVYTETIATEVVKDLSSMVGKMDEFKDIINAEIAKYIGGTAPFGFNDIAGLYDGLTSIYVKQIEVDSENISAEDDFIEEIAGRQKQMLGFYEIDGFPVFGFNLGGDWESPVYGVFVSDGTNLYSYIPLCGNSYNPKYFSAYGNNDDGEDGDDAQCNFDMIMQDIVTAFCIKPTMSEETSNEIASIEESIEELVEAVEALTDDETGVFLRNGLEDIVEKIKETVVNAGASNRGLNTKLTAANAEIDNLKKSNDDLIKKLDYSSKRNLDLSSELAKYKSGAISTSSAEADAYKEIAKIVAAVSGGMPIPTAGSITTPIIPSAPVPAAPSKPLKKISLPTKTITYEYVYGVEMDGSTAILHIIKKDDWARDELAKEGRVDVDTISRLKAEVPLKRDKFIYILDNPYDNVEDVVSDVSKVTGINLVHSDEVQAKF